MSGFHPLQTFGERPLSSDSGRSPAGYSIALHRCFTVPAPPGTWRCVLDTPSTLMVGGHEQCSAAQLIGRLFAKNLDLPSVPKEKKRAFLGLLPALTTKLSYVQICFCFASRLIPKRADPVSVAYERVDLEIIPNGTA
jgi:hypothetical protein